MMVLERIRTKPEKNRWVVFAGPNPLTKVRLLAFPYAGGGASVFRGWGAEAPAIELGAIQLPGREGRLAEVPFTSFDALIPALADALIPLTDRPYALFGHSVGAIQVFELTREFQRRGVRMPLACFVSGRPAPQTISGLPAIHHLPEEEFLQRVKSLDGTPNEVMANAELVALLLPLLRADFELAWSYVYRDSPPIPVPIVAFGGDVDHDVAISDLRNWSAQTSVSFDALVLPGGHFFLHAHQQRIMFEIVQRLGLGDDGVPS